MMNFTRCWVPRAGRLFVDSSTGHLRLGAHGAWGDILGLTFAADVNRSTRSQPYSWCASVAFGLLTVFKVVLFP